MVKKADGRAIQNRGQQPCVARLRRGLLFHYKSFHSPEVTGSPTCLKTQMKTKVMRTTLIVTAWPASLGMTSLRPKRPTASLARALRKTQRGRRSRRGPEWCPSSSGFLGHWRAGSWIWPRLKDLDVQRWTWRRRYWSSLHPSGGVIALILYHCVHARPQRCALEAIKWLGYS